MFKVIGVEVAKSDLSAEEGWTGLTGERHKISGGCRILYLAACCTAIYNTNTPLEQV